MEVQVEDRTVRLTNLDKVLFPRTGFTKRDVIDYYARVAPALLPHVRDRPLTLRRFPDGVEAPHRYEKCCPDRRPDWLQVARVWSERRGEHLPFCLVQDLPSLMWSANLANLELHPMLAVAPDFDRPTVVGFDLDPGPPATIVDGCTVALLLRDVLDGVGLRSFVKTSGAKGLHLFVPLNTPTTYRETKAFARTLAEMVAARLPERVTASTARDRRAGKVLVDWGQNDRHKSIVAPWSLRGTPVPSVSAPLRWEEVEAATTPDDLHVPPDQALERLDREGDLWAPVLSRSQRLP